MARSKSTPTPAAWRSRHAAFFQRKGLPRSFRHAAALSALAADGDWIGFELQLAWALRERARPAWLREVLLQSYLFVGYPRAIQALQILARQAPATGSRLWSEPRRPTTWIKRGRALCRTIYGHQYEPLLVVMHRTHPDLADWMIEEGYGKVLSRSFLTPRVRELCVVPILVAQEAWPQLASHLSGSLRVGARRSEVAESLETGLRMVPDADKEKARSLWKRAVA